MASGLVDLGDHPAVQQLRAVLQAFGSEDKQQGDHQKAVQELRALVRASEIPGLAEDTQARLRAVKDDLMHLLDGAVHVVDDVKVVRQPKRPIVGQRVGHDVSECPKVWLPPSS